MCEKQLLNRDINQRMLRNIKELSVLNLRKQIEAGFYKFNSIRHPLSEQGNDFKLYITRILNNHNSPSELLKALSLFPTIRNLHSEYFQDLFTNNKLAENKKKEILLTLNAIAIAQGCSHHCSFCVVKAPSLISFMSYITILKIIKEIKKYNLQYDVKIKDFIRFINTKKLNIKLLIEIIFITEKRQLLLYKNNYLPSAMLLKLCDFLHLKSAIKNDIKKIFYLSKSNYSGEIQREMNKYFKKRLHQIPTLKYSELKEIVTLSKPRMIHYYRNDDLDYRDFTIINRGYPIDYGDIYKLFFDLGYSVDITTACWNVSDNIAQRAAEKISKIGIGSPNSFIISYHGYSIQARNNFERYLDSVINTVKTITQNPNNKIYIRCEDRNNQIIKLIHKLQEDKVFNFLNIPIVEVKNFLNKGIDINNKRIAIVKSYRKILEANRDGEKKIIGKTLGYSIDYNGDLYARFSLSDNYQKIGNIW